MYHKLICILFSTMLLWAIPRQVSAEFIPKPLKDGKDVLPGAYRMQEYLPLLKGKRVALLINQTSEIRGVSLLDTLLHKDIKIVKVFVPEHGFRGDAPEGASINNGIDSATNTPIVSLYGDNKKPKPAQLTDVDVVVYDLQDVGCRFYTYISTMQYAMEACAENKKLFIILDRPNPIGHFIDGPVLKPEFKSFVGMQPIPIVYGMTVGEYAQMLIGEKWVKGTDKMKIKIIACDKYDHNTLYELPVRPSPNLKTFTSVLCYPSLCLFEGTIVSVGRGTDLPFQVFGHPNFAHKSIYSFRPIQVWGKAAPLYAFKDCYGQIVAMNHQEALSLMNRCIRLIWLIRAYDWSLVEDKKNFFNPFFDKLAGTDELRKQLIEGKNETEIKATWQDGITAFKKIRKKYLLYPDFE